MRGESFICGGKRDVHKFISFFLNLKGDFRLMDVKGVLASGIEELEKEKK